MKLIKVICIVNDGIFSSSNRPCARSKHLDGDGESEENP